MFVLKDHGTKDNFFRIFIQRPLHTRCPIPDPPPPSSAFTSHNHSLSPVIPWDIFEPSNSIRMKKLFVLLIAFALVAVSCSRYVSVEQAANGKARCGKGLR